MKLMKRVKKTVRSRNPTTRFFLSEVSTMTFLRREGTGWMLLVSN